VEILACIGYAGNLLTATNAQGHGCFGYFPKTSGNF